MQLLTALTLATLASSAWAIGIPTCRGSAKCINTPGDIQGVKNLIDTISPRTKSYAPSELIACDGNKCAFFNVQGGTAAEASEYLQKLLDHGCRTCGEEATKSNFVQDGSIQVNYKDEPCDGVC